MTERQTKSSFRFVYFLSGLALIIAAASSLWGWQGVAMVGGIWFTLGTAFDIAIEAIRRR